MVLSGVWKTPEVDLQIILFVISEEAALFFFFFLYDERMLTFDVIILGSYCIISL